MAVRALKLSVYLLVFCLVWAQPSRACFGPKLFVGAGADVEARVLYALVTLYIQEKTGVESTAVALAPGADPLRLIRDDKADLVITGAAVPVATKMLRLGERFFVISGTRPREDLQFTTVLPALSKLERLLTETDVRRLADRVDAGDSPAAVAREFFMERRWI